MNSTGLIRVYADEGTARVDVLIKSILLALTHLAHKYPPLRNLKVKPIFANEVINKSWINETRLFVFPGGRDLPYCKKLDGRGVENIRTFVQQNGGSLLGLCAGAYFSSCFVDFERGTPLEVVGSRELCLFKGTAKGSVYPYSYQNTQTARVVPINLIAHNSRNKVSHVYFNGGCRFKPFRNLSDIHRQYGGTSDIQVVATYADFPDQTAVLNFRSGAGRVLLSGVHPEMDPAFLPQAEYTSMQWAAIEKYKNEQRDLFQTFLRTLLVTNSKL